MSRSSATTWRNAVARTLSGGMKRRLMIARALVHEPKLLILDEPTAGVDIELRRSMWAFLRKINAAGTTIILTTHYLEEAESLCRNIAIIDDGRIIEHTDIQTLLRSLKTQSFVLDVRGDSDGIDQLDGYNLRYIDGETLEADLPSNQTLTALFRDLAGVGIEVTGMKNKSNRLEELFLRLIEGETREQA